MTPQRLIGSFTDTFAPLKSREMRLYFGGQAVSLLGTWMQVTAQSWVVWKLSQSTAVLGLVAMLSMLPFLVLGPWAGVLADRMDRRRFLIGSQAAAMILALILAVLVQTGTVQVWHVGVLALLLGIVNTFDLTVQQSFVIDLADKSSLRKTVVLNFALIQVGRMAGPALAGWVISAVGVAIAFWLNGFSFLAVIATLFLIRSQQERHESTGKPLAEFREGLSFILRQSRLLDLVAILFIITFFAIATLQLLPAFATDVLHGGADTLGVLQGASGAGALVGALFVAPIALRVKRIGRMVTYAAGFIGAWYIVFSLSKTLPLSLISLFFAGVGANILITTVIGIVQLQVPASMRGRANSVLMMVAFGFQPIAALLLGFFASIVGTPVTVTIGGILMVGGAGYFLLFRPALRTWEVSSEGAEVQPSEEATLRDAIPLEIEPMAL